MKHNFDEMLRKSVCNWCGVVGHIEKACYIKANGTSKGGRLGGSRGGRVGSGRGDRGGGYPRFGGGDGDEEANVINVM